MIGVGLGLGHRLGIGSSRIAHGNKAPTNLRITWAVDFPDGAVPEDTASGTTLGTLASTDPDGDSVTFAVHTDPDAKFAIVGNALKLNAALDFTIKTTHPVTVRASDTHAAYIDRTFTIAVGADDTIPAAFSFTDVTAAALDTQYESDAIVVSGIDAAAALTITGGQYQINGGAWASSPTTVINGASIKVRATSSADPDTAVNVALTIGGVSDTFTITTSVGEGGGGGDWLLSGGVWNDAGVWDDASVWEDAA